MTVLIHRTPGRKSKRIFFYPTVNGKRINGINYARKYDAVALAREFIRINQVKA